jgi:cytochrome c biogenesis protein CcmG, thiol:disulfide interchange protein DsbE
MTHPHRAPKNRTLPVIWLGLVSGVVLIAVGLFGLATQAGVSASHSGGTVEFSVNDFSGKTVRLSDFRGHPVVVNLWASWCPPCRAEMPTLIQFYQAHQPEGLVFLAVNSEDDSPLAQAFMSRIPLPFTVLYDPEGQIMRALGADGLPDTFLIDRNSMLRFSWTGEISQDILDQRVAPLLTQ